jgi:hypothetical protein
MQTLQFASYDQNTETIWFETRHIGGCYYAFALTKNQFLRLDNVIALLQENHNYRRYPLGENMWFDYNLHHIKLYEERDNRNRVTFSFESFEEYKRYTHPRLHSLICQSRHGRRRQQESLTTHQRSLPVTMQSRHRHLSPKGTCRRKRKAISRAANNVKLSRYDETGSVLSEWEYTNPRQSDAASIASSANTHLSPPVSVRLESSDVTMESE